MAVRTLAYECRYCGTLKKTRKLCERHELACLKNPDARNCTLCEHIDKHEKPARCGVSGKMCSSAVSAQCTTFKRRDSV